MCTALIPDDPMSSKNTYKAELRIGHQRDKRNEGLIHLLKPIDILERGREKESEALSSASLQSQQLKPLNIDTRGVF